MKLNYANKRIVTTADLFDACDPPLIFEVRTRPPREWARVNKEFEDTGSNNPELAAKSISMTFLTVSDGENAYPISTVEQVEQMARAIDDGNPGYGDDFLCTTAQGFAINYFNYLGDNQKNSLGLSLQLNGNSPEKSQAKVS